MSDAELTKMLRSSASRVVNYAADRIEQLTAERDRLREALTVISQFSATTQGSANIHAIWKMTERASAALKGDSHDDDHDDDHGDDDDADAHEDRDEKEHDED